MLLLLARLRPARAPGPSSAPGRLALARPSPSRWAATLVDQGRAHHRAIGDLGDGGRLGGVADAEADGDRQIGMALQPRYRPGDIGIGGRAGAGDAGDGDVIDEARGIAQHGGQALVVGGRRGEADEMQARRLGRQAELLILLRRQIDDDQPIDARVLRIRQELRHAILIDRIVVAHQHDGRRRRPRGGSRAPGPGSSSSSARRRARAARRPGSPARPPWDR